MKLHHQNARHWGYTTQRYNVVKNRKKFHRYDYNRVLYWFKCISFLHILSTLLAYIYI